MMRLAAAGSAAMLRFRLSSRRKTMLPRPPRTGRVKRRNRSSTRAIKLYPAGIIATVPPRNSKLSLVLLGLSAASLIADAALLAGAVLIR